MHVMLDIETWSTRKSAAVSQIGAVPFELRDRGKVLNDKAFKRHVLFDQNIGAVDHGTLAFWLSQGKAADRLSIALQTDAIPMHQALLDLVDWPATWGATWDEVEGVWGWGAAFDNAIMEFHFENHGIPVPWHYRLNMCARTMHRFLGSPEVPADPTLVEHDAVDDCIQQIKTLQIGLANQAHRA